MFLTLLHVSNYTFSQFSQQSTSGSLLHGNAPFGGSTFCNPDPLKHFHAANTGSVPSMITLTALLKF